MTVAPAVQERSAALAGWIVVGVSFLALAAAQSARAALGLAMPLWEAEFGWSRSDRIDNYVGTYTFASLEDFEAGRPRQFTVRTGDPLVTYTRQELSWFVHDEITLSDRVRVGLGVRHVGESAAAPQQEPTTTAPPLTRTRDGQGRFCVTGRPEQVPASSRRRRPRRKTGCRSWPPRCSTR